MTLLPCFIPVFPLLAFVINLFWGKRLNHASGWVSVAASTLSCALSLYLITLVIQSGTLKANWSWIPLGHTALKFGYLLDPLAATLLFVVTVIGTLIQVYSIGYMHGDPRFSRFFAYVSLFMFAMLTLVIASNYLVFFMAWEVMGLCSYLLIGFWFEKNSAADAGRKAFITTRIGDVGFFLGIMTLYLVSGNLQFFDLPLVAKAVSPLLPVAAVLIFCGTIGKSAQFPLHVWLPDAMEGPTPVSALIHAATMVAAGVYLIARSFPLFAAFPHVLTLVAFIGTLTALMAAFIALTATDIKKILAYSTISQLGYMVAALGLGGFSAGTFHLMTHAFFKALLFLGAGSVIHGTGTQNIFEMGGLLKKMKHTGWTFIIGSLAIAGVPPLSGFWSKDEILSTALHSHHPVIFILLLLCAFTTAFYMFRLVFVTFFGEARNHAVHPHESPAVMTLPLWLLAAGAVLVGIPGSPVMHHWFQSFLEPAHHGAIQPDWGVMSLSVLAGIGGIFLAWLFYRKAPEKPKALVERFQVLYRLSLNKLWLDEIYQVYLIEPFKRLAALLFRFDHTVIDRAVNETGLQTVFLSKVKGWIDLYLVDGLVNLTGQVTQALGGIVRRIQTGFIQHYLLIVVFGILFLIFFELRY